ncbi:MAG: hypothetical protein K0R15_1363 [Clostridiales bacterium]|jgi:hypothetical protein|nr:hypothetical protein [Clostridiales bacterium]
MKKIIILLLGVVMLLTSCATTTEVTDEDYETVGIRMAGVLKKYDNNSQGEINLEEVKETTTDTKETTTDTKEVTTGTQEVITDTQGVTTTQPGEIIKDTNVKDETSNSEVVAEISDDIIDIEYLGYELSKSYPNESSEQVYAYVEAVDEAQIIILKFNLTNNNKVVQDIKHFAEITNFKLLIDNKYLYSPLSTLLDTDIITGKISLQPGETKQAVIVFQIQDLVAKNMNDLLLIVTRPNKKELLAV